MHRRNRVWLALGVLVAVLIVAGLAAWRGETRPDLVRVDGGASWERVL